MFDFDLPNLESRDLLCSNMASTVLAFDPLGMTSCSRAGDSGLICSTMAFKGLDALMMSSCSRTLDSLASTTSLSSNHPATEDEDDDDAVENVSETSRDSDDADDVAELKLPQTQTLPDLRQVVVQKLKGTWAGQGASYGDLYVVESHGAFLRCQRKGLSSRKVCTLTWDASKNQVVLGGRYTLDPSVLLADHEQVVWSRVAEAGKDCKEVTWKRFERAQKITLAATSENHEMLQSLKVEQCGHEVQGNDRSQRVYSRSLMLSVHCRTPALKNCADKKFISLKRTSEIQFICPAVAPACRPGTSISNKASKIMKPSGSVPSAIWSSQGDSDICAQLAASSTEKVLTLLAKAPASKKQAKTSSCDFVKPNPDSALEDSPANQLAAKLAKLVCSTPVAPSKMLRNDAPEFVPSAALRADAQEFVPCSMADYTGSPTSCTSDTQVESDADSQCSNDSSLEVSSASD